MKKIIALAFLALALITGTAVVTTTVQPQHTAACDSSNC
jgi:Flp pilus assembly pilin Flp